MAGQLRDRLTFKTDRRAATILKKAAACQTVTDCRKAFDMSADIENVTLMLVRNMRDEVTAGLIEMRGATAVITSRVDAGLFAMHGLVERMNDRMTAGLSELYSRIAASSEGIAGFLSELRSEIHTTNERVEVLAAAVGENNERITSLRSDLQLHHSELDKRLSGLEHELRKSGLASDRPTT